MDNLVYISPENNSSKPLKTAIVDLNNAQKKLQSLHSEMQKAHFVPSGDSWLIFDIGCSTAINDINNRLGTIQEKLNAYSQIIDMASYGFSSIDERYRKGWFDKLRDKAGEYWNSTVSGIKSIFGGLGVFGLFFKRGGAKTGAEVIIEEDITDETEDEEIANINDKTVVVSNDYMSGVKKGEIRYVSQTYDLEKNGWGSFGGAAIVECGYASQSMALSYIGKDAPPEYLMDGEYNKGYWETGYGSDSTYCIGGISVVEGSGAVSGSLAKQTIDWMLDSFISDGNRGEISPVIIHSNAGPEKMHAIIVVGRNDDGSYIALDPARGNQQMYLTISEDGIIGGDVEGVGYALDRVQQYRNIS